MTPLALMLLVLLVTDIVLTVIRKLDIFVGTVIGVLLLIFLWQFGGIF